MDTEAGSSKREEVKSLDSSFFESLWPLILDDNQCRIESESAEYFVPHKPFDKLYWHTMLFKVGFPDYTEPIVLRCCKAAKQEEESELEAVKAANKAAENQSTGALGDYLPTGSRAIRRVDEEVEHLRGQLHRRQRLGYAFANRKYPWCMQKPLHEIELVLTKEQRTRFKCPMEREILEGILYYNCKLMIIDASTEVCVDDLHRWVKFRPYVQMLCLVRCPRVQRHVQLLNVFHTLFIEEDMNNSWHEQLHCSLNAGLTDAKKLELFKSCAEVFVFVFSRYRGLCTCDTYKFMRHF